MSTIPPRMLEPPTTVLEQEERIRAYWMIEALDSCSTLGTAWNISLTRPDNLEWLPCSDELWSFPESLHMLSFDESQLSSVFASYVRFATNELWHVHHLLQQPWNIASDDGRTRYWEACQDLDPKFSRWLDEFDQLTNRPVSDGDRPRPIEPNVLLAFCTFHQ